MTHVTEEGTPDGDQELGRQTNFIMELLSPLLKDGTRGQAWNHIYQSLAVFKSVATKSTQPQERWNETMGPVLKRSKTIEDQTIHASFQYQPVPSTADASPRDQPGQPVPSTAHAYPRGQPAPSTAHVPQRSQSTSLKRSREEVPAKFEKDDDGTGFRAKYERPPIRNRREGPRPRNMPIPHTMTSKLAPGGVYKPNPGHVKTCCGRNGFCSFLEPLKAMTQEERDYYDLHGICWRCRVGKHQADGCDGIRFCCECDPRPGGLCPGCAQ